MAAFSKTITKPPSSKILEMLVAHSAVQFALELGFEHSVFEGNSEVIIKALVDGNFSLASIGHLVKDVIFISGLLQTQSFSQRVRLSFPLLVWMEDGGCSDKYFSFLFVNLPVNQQIAAKFGFLKKRVQFVNINKGLSFLFYLPYAHVSKMTVH